LRSCLSLHRVSASLRQQHWLNTVGYGNRTIGSEVDSFWLDNTLKVSADEQAEFLKNLLKEQLPFSRRSMDIAENILPSERHGTAVLKYKAGTGHTDHHTAWLVGYIEKGDEVYVFAFNVDGEKFDETSGLRNDIPREIMKELGIL